VDALQRSTLTGSEETAAANLDIKAAMARVDQAARHAIGRGKFLSAVDLNASARRSGSTTGTSTTYSLPFSLGYEFDVWGRLRRQFEATKNNEQASAADLEFVRQTAIADVAQSYFTIRLYDRQIASYEAALGLYRKQLELTDTNTRRAFRCRPISCRPGRRSIPPPTNSSR